MKSTSFCPIAPLLPALVLLCLVACTSREEQKPATPAEPVQQVAPENAPAVGSLPFLPQESAEATPEARRDETTYLTETDFNRIMAGGPASPVATPLPVDSKTTSATVEGTTIAGYLATPRQGAMRHTLLVLPEWWGVNAALKKEADIFAAAGNRVFVLDLFDGKVPADRREAMTLAAELETTQALQRVAAALAWLGGEVGPGAKITLMGLGLGGQLALDYAIDGGAPPAALALFYGELPTLPADLAKTAAVLKQRAIPVIGFYGARDGWVSPAKVGAFTSALTAAGVDNQIYSYDTNSGFMISGDNMVDSGYRDSARATLEEFIARRLGE